MIYLDNYTSETIALYFLMVIHELEENYHWYFKYSHISILSWFSFFYCFIQSLHDHLTYPVAANYIEICDLSFFPIICNYFLHFYHILYHKSSFLRSTPSTSFPLPLFPRSTPLSFPSRKKAGLPGLSTVYSITSYSKTSHNPPPTSWQGETN